MEEGHRLIWESVPPESMVSLTVGRVMTALLSARPRKLHDAVSRLSPDPKRGSLGTSLSLSHTHTRGLPPPELSSVLVFEACIVSS
jgi:hypothetical protein